MDMANILLEETKKVAEINYRLSWAAADDYRPDLILASAVSISEGLAIAQKLRRPLVIGASIPLYPSREYALVTVRAKPFSVGVFNLMLHWLVFKTGWALTGGPMINKFRKELELPPQKSYHMDAAPMLCFYSEEVAPRAHDWPEFVRVTGYWTIRPSSDQQLPEEVEDFLSAGAPPVYMGFGSMPLKDARATATQFVAALERLGMRGILCSGWSKEGFHEATQGHPHVLLVKDVPHELLFPRCSIAIHHGGAGTTAASLRAGIPTIIFPFFGDQPFWAHRLAELGVGPPEVVPLKEMTQESLEAQIVATASDDIKHKAARLGEVLRSEEEDGVRVAAKWLDMYSRETRTAPSSDQPEPHMRWVPDEECAECQGCAKAFGLLLNRRHHCRVCGGIFCASCLTQQRLLNYPFNQPQLVCGPCTPHQLATPPPLDRDGDEHVRGGVCQDWAGQLQEQAVQEEDDRKGQRARWQGQPQPLLRGRHEDRLVPLVVHLRSVEPSASIDQKDREHRRSRGL